MGAFACASTAEGIRCWNSGDNSGIGAFPNTGHNVIVGSPTSAAANPENCGMKLFIEFLRQPTATLDTSCTNNILPLDFEGTGKVSTVDVPNYWDNE